MRFQNGFNKVVIELLVMQFWSEIILVISNRTRAARSFDFEITRMISDQIALHSVQLPLFIYWTVCPLAYDYSQLLALAKAVCCLFMRHWPIFLPIISYGAVLIGV